MVEGGRVRGVEDRSMTCVCVCGVRACMNGEIGMCYHLTNMRSITLISPIFTANSPWLGLVGGSSMGHTAMPISLTLLDNSSSRCRKK